MLKTLTLCLIAFVAILTPLTAQTIKVGKPTKTADDKSFIETVGIDESNIYILENNDIDDCYLYKYDFDMTLIMKAKLTMPSRAAEKFEYNIYSGVVLSDNKLWFMYSYSNNKSGQCKFYKVTIDKKSLTINNDEQLIYTTPEEQNRMFPYRRVKRRDISYWEFSPDKNYIAFFGHQTAKKTKENIMQLTVCDKSLQKVWTQTYTIPRARDFENLKKYGVDNQGNAFILFDTNKQGKTSTLYKIFRATKDNTKLDEIDISLGDKQIVSSTMVVIGDNEIECGGFYTKDISVESMSHGIFNIIVDFSKKSIKRKTTQDFSEEFILQGMSEKVQEKFKKKSGKKKELSLGGCKIQHILKREDKGFYLIGEQANMVAYNMPERGSRVSASVYVLNIITIGINSKGEFEWMKQIPKEETYAPNSMGNLYTSYVPVLTKKDTLHIVFSDYESNINGKRWKELSDKGDNYVTIVTYNTKGEFQEKVLYKSDVYKSGLLPYFSTQISENAVILGNRGEKDQRFIKVEF